MNLVTHCSSCKKEIKIKSKAATRPDLQMQKGDEIKVNCQNCGKMEKKHVNEVRAIPNNTIILIGVIIGVFSAIFLWLFYGGIASVSFIIPLLFWQQQSNASKSFNSYMIRRK